MKSFGIWLVLSYLRFLAYVTLRLSRPPVIIGIAGSVGKSSTCNALEAILRDFGRTVAIGNSETGIPLGLVGIKPEGFTAKDWLRMLLKAPLGIFFLKGTKYLIVEMGIDDPYPPKNMSYLLRILQPDIGILVNESAAHTLQFEKILSPTQRKDMTESERLQFLTEKIAEEDALMIVSSHCKAVIFNADNQLITHEVEKRREKGNIVTLSFGKEKNNSLSYTSYTVNKTGVTMEFLLQKTPVTISFPYLLPKVYQEVVGASLLASWYILSEKNPPEIRDITNSLTNNYVLPKGRASIFEGIHNSLLIDSTYNASKTSVIAFLELLESLKKNTGRQAVFVFGDMRELGEEAKGEHLAVAEKIATVCDAVYCVGPLTKEFVVGYLQEKKKKVTWFPSNIEAGKYLQKELPPHSIVLLKGSQNTIFLEECLKYLLKHHKDTSKLCRQDSYWLSLKKNTKRLYLPT